MPLNYLLSCSQICSNNYTRNQATFNLSDELVLNDGVLYDMRMGREIRKLDKLNQNLNGVFHPNGLEIISSSEIWDIRTFHLLKTVKGLDNCTVSILVQWCMTLTDMGLTECMGYTEKSATTELFM